MSAVTQGLLTAFTQYAEPELRDAAGNLVATVHRYTEANARRLAACWNACDGLSTDFLEQIDSIQAALTGQLIETQAVEAQLDDLLEALKLADCLLRGANMNRNVVERKVRAAIAKVKGGAA